MPCNKFNGYQQNHYAIISNVSNIMWQGTNDCFLDRLKWSWANHFLINSSWCPVLRRAEQRCAWPETWRWRAMTRNAHWGGPLSARGSDQGYWCCGLTCPVAKLPLSQAKTAWGEGTACTASQGLLPPPHEDLPKPAQQQLCTSWLTCVWWSSSL